MAATDSSHTPDDVTDVLLWRMAVRVAAAHQPDAHDPGRCVNPRCVHDVYPCPPARDARKALQAATRPSRTTPGRARVTAVAQRFLGWFRPTRPTAHATSTAPALPRRQPMASLRLAT